MNTLTELYRGIIERPLDLVARSVYADALEEDGSDPSRVEFIRLQLELSKLQEKPPYGLVKQNALRIKTLKRWEETLLKSHWKKWYGSVKFPVIHCGNIINKKLYILGPVYNFINGFVGKVTVPHKKWIELCHELILEMPLQEVVFSDRAPYYNLESGFGWYNWSIDETPTDLSQLPDELIALIPETKYYEDYSDHERNFGGAQFETPLKAQEAASKAAIQWARKIANLPEELK